MIEFYPASNNVDCLINYQKLFKLCFPRSKKFTIEYLQWLYSDNPDGSVVGFDAYDSGLLVAHYACIPALVKVLGVPRISLLSVNTATHPNYQGQGLFTKLASFTYSDAIKNGYYCVYGVANSNSSHGFIKKLNFQLVRSLNAKIGIGALFTPGNSDVSLIDFERCWNSKSLIWRLKNPSNPVHYESLTGRQCFSASAFGGFISPYAELDQQIVLDDSISSSPRYSPSIKLYLGVESRMNYRRNNYFDIPEKFRPSPLNLIFLPLSGENIKLNPNSINFSFLDFDVY